jgi:hypothetical protein
MKKLAEAEVGKCECEFENGAICNSRDASYMHCQRDIAAFLILILILWNVHIATIA